MVGDPTGKADANRGERLAFSSGLGVNGVGKIPVRAELPVPFLAISCGVPELAGRCIIRPTRSVTEIVPDTGLGVPDMMLELWNDGECFCVVPGRFVLTRSSTIFSIANSTAGCKTCSFSLAPLACSRLMGKASAVASLADFTWACARILNG